MYNESGCYKKNRCAKCFVYGYDQDDDEVVFLLNKKNMKNRFKLANVLRMKFVPEIQFLKHNVISHVGQIDELLEIVHEKSKITLLRMIPTMTFIHFLTGKS